MQGKLATIALGLGLTFNALCHAQSKLTDYDPDGPEFSVTLPSGHKVPIDVDRLSLDGRPTYGFLMQLDLAYHLDDEALGKLPPAYKKLYREISTQIRRKIEEKGASAAPEDCDEAVRHLNTHGLTRDQIENVTSYAQQIYRAGMDREP